MWGLGAGLKESGRTLQRIGTSLQGGVLFEDASKHRRLVPILNQKPHVGQASWVAPNATVVGRVDIAEKSAIWYGAVVRGDVNSVRIGHLTSIGERVTIHVASSYPAPSPTIIGNRVIVEPAAVLHACTIEDEVKIGSGTIVCDGAVVRKQSIVGAGSVVAPGKTIPSGELWEGLQPSLCVN